MVMCLSEKNPLLFPLTNLNSVNSPIPNRALILTPFRKKPCRAFLFSTYKSQ